MASSKKSMKAYITPMETYEMSRRLFTLGRELTSAALSVGRVEHDNPRERQAVVDLYRRAVLIELLNYLNERPFYSRDLLNDSRLDNMFSQFEFRLKLVRESMERAKAGNADGTGDS